MQPVRYQPVAPMDLLQRQALGVEVKRHSLAGLGHQRGLVLRVQPAHPYRLAGLAQQQVSPALTCPAKAVPVTTTPAPATANARSTARRKPPRALR